MYLVDYDKSIADPTTVLSELLLQITPETDGIGPSTPITTTGVVELTVSVGIHF